MPRPPSGPAVGAVCRQLQAVADAVAVVPDGDRSPVAGQLIARGPGQRHPDHRRRRSPTAAVRTAATPPAAGRTARRPPAAAIRRDRGHRHAPAASPSRPAQRSTPASSTGSPRPAARRSPSATHAGADRGRRLSAEARPAAAPRAQRPHQPTDLPVRGSRRRAARRRRCRGARGPLARALHHPAARRPRLGRRPGGERRPGHPGADHATGRARAGWPAPSTG